MRVNSEAVIAPKSGLAVEVKTGQLVRVVNLEGKQVVDMVVFNLHNLREKLSTSYSRCRYTPQPGAEYVARDHIQEGDTLMSTICNPMMTIVKETMDPKGLHDVHQRMCNRRLYELYGLEPRDGCLEIIARAIVPYGLLPEDVPDTMDLFENVQHDCEKGHWVFGESPAQAGDYIEFRAEMDCLVVFSNCPEDTLTPLNAKRSSPVKVEIHDLA